VSGSLSVSDIYWACRLWEINPDSTITSINFRCFILYSFLLVSVKKDLISYFAISQPFTKILDAGFSD